MREDKHRDTAGLENAMKCLHASRQIRRVHEYVVRDEHVEFGVTDRCQIGARVDAEIPCRIVPSCDRNHALGEVDACNQGAMFRELDRQVPRTATGIKYPKSLNIAHELPENGV